MYKDIGFTELFNGDVFVARADCPPEIEVFTKGILCQTGEEVYTLEIYPTFDEHYVYAPHFKIAPSDYGVTGIVPLYAGTYLKPNFCGEKLTIKDLYNQGYILLRSKTTGYGIDPLIWERMKKDEFDKSVDDRNYMLKKDKEYKAEIEMLQNKINKIKSILYDEYDC